MSKRGFLFCFLIATTGFASTASANEPRMMMIEGTGAMPLTTPQKDWFGFGGGGAISAYRSLGRNVVLGLRARVLALSSKNAPVPQGVEPRTTGTFGSLSFALRLRPFSWDESPRRATGFWIEGAAGGGLTGGDVVRFGFEGGMGYGIGLSDSIALSPMVRYLQIVEPSGGLNDADARILLAGFEVAFFDGATDDNQKGAAAGPAAVEKKEAPKADRDDDGVPDSEDKCPNRPEDLDGFEDEDGCPDPDNDKDGVPDIRDRCPKEPEDIDQFEDDDGCPDKDNDKDGILDTIDRCPNQPEVLNGVEDQDGCPDQGLIEMVSGRVVLEEKVLFDLGMARVRNRARPPLKALVELWKQHPEWEKMRVEGHADVRGSDELNQILSERRAANVVKQLIKLGFPHNRVEYVGYGKSHPRDLHNTEEAYERNRRVEFVILKGPGTEGGTQ